MQVDPRDRAFGVLEGQRLLVGRRRREMPRVDLFPFEGRPDGRAGIGRALRRPNAVRVLGGQAVFTSGFEVYFVVPGPHLRAAARGRAWAAVAIHRDDGVARELPK